VGGFRSALGLKLIGN